MGAPAVVAGDHIVATCEAHLVNGPSGAPQPAGPLPFDARIVSGVATRTLVGGRPAALLGSGGPNVPPHPLPLVDPPGLLQQGRIVQGSGTVAIEGQPAARDGSAATVCGNRPGGRAVGTVANVLIGG